MDRKEIEKLWNAGLVPDTVWYMNEGDVQLRKAFVELWKKVASEGKVADTGGAGMGWEVEKEGRKVLVYSNTEGGSVELDNEPIVCISHEFPEYDGVMDEEVWNWVVKVFDL